jgi:hypothetical protein
MVSFTKTNARGLLILLVILFAALAISILYPFYRGVQEGLTGAELDPAAPIKTALLKYSNTVESNCQVFTNSYASIAGLGQADIASINGICGNTNFTNTAKFHQIVALNSKNKGLLDAIHEVQGKNFAALVGLLHELPSNTNDDTFNSMVNQQMTNVNKIINSTDMSSPYYTINTYVQNRPASS